MSDNKVPTNAVNNKTGITGTYAAGDANYGWYYVSASGLIYAANNSTW